VYKCLRIQRLKREAATIQILRRKKQSISNIASFLGRSTSFVSRILHNITTLSFPLDKRKLPRAIVLKNCFAQRFLLEKLRSSWESFLFGEVDKPP